MSSDQLAALGAFLSGFGSAATAYFFVRAERKRLAQECQDKLDMLREGIRIAREEKSVTTPRKRSGSGG